MKTSTDRILVTLVGSLPRSQAVTDVPFARERGDSLDESAARATYIKNRLTGFAGDTPREPGQDLVEFPRILQRLAQTGATAKYTRPRCVAEIRVSDLQSRVRVGTHSRRHQLRAGLSKR